MYYLGYLHRVHDGTVFYPVNNATLRIAVVTDRLLQEPLVNLHRHAIVWLRDSTQPMYGLVWVFREETESDTGSQISLMVAVIEKHLTTC